MHGVRNPPDVGHLLSMASVSTQAPKIKTALDVSSRLNARISYKEPKRVRAQKEMKVLSP